MTYEEIEQTKIYVGDGKFNLPHPCQLIDPFMDIVKPFGGTFDFNHVLGASNQDKEDEGGSINTSLARLACKVKMPQEFDIFLQDTAFSHLFGEIGFVYAFDTQKPVMKVYRGNRVTVCTNLCVWGADNLTEILFTSNHKILYDNVKRWLDSALRDTEKAREIIGELNSQQYDKDGIDRMLGKLLRFGAKTPKLGVTPVVDAAKSLIDPKSKYYVQDSASGWLLYNSVTESLKKVNILDESSKSLLLEKVFLN